MKRLCVHSELTLVLMMSKKCYSELIEIPSFLERFEYLKIGGHIGVETFGNNRYLNQIFYSSKEWRRFRNDIIIRDKSCDLGIEGRDITKVYIHHIIPITADDVIRRSPLCLDPENVICVCHNTHEAIHYSDSTILIPDIIERRPNDTTPWKR